MQRAFNLKEEKMRSRLRDKVKRRGNPIKHANQLAEPTVNKKLRMQELLNVGSQGVGNLDFQLEKRTKTELNFLARKMSIAGRSRMAKEELIEAIRDFQETERH